MFVRKFKTVIASGSSLTEAFNQLDAELEKLALTKGDELYLGEVLNLSTDIEYLFAQQVSYLEE